MATSLAPSHTSPVPHLKSVDLKASTSTAKKQLKQHNTVAHLMAGAIGGAAGTVVTCPLEVVRTRLQASHNKEAFVRHSGLFRGTCQSIGAIYEVEGLRGLWRGLGPALMGVIPARAVQFAAYSFMKKTLVPFVGENTALHLMSASVAGAISTTAIAPLWLVKTRLQLQTNEMKRTGLAYKGSWDCIKRVSREEGIRGLYKGLTASYLGIAGLSIQFSLYEKGKKYVLSTKTRAVGEGLSPVEYLTVASAAKAIASVITYPHEVLRTRFREQRYHRKYTGIIQACRLIVREEGVAGLYGGLGPHLLKVVPNAAIMFLTYEFVVSMLAAPRSSSL